MPRLPRVRALRAVPVLLAAACSLGRPVEPARRPPIPERDAVGCVDERSLDAVRRANGERTRRGLRALEPDARLQEAAQRHAADMARGDFMAHEGADGSLAPERAMRRGYRWTTVAENVAAGYPDPAAVVAGWMASPGHRENLLDPRVRHVGVGYAYRTDTRMHSYWVMVFGDSEGVRATPEDCG